MEQSWDDKLHYGISWKRASELEGGSDYPRGSAALFHFDKLTPQEKAQVIMYEEEHLEYLQNVVREIPLQARKNAQVDRSLGIKHTPIKNYKQHLIEAKENVVKKQALIAYLRERIQRNECP